MELLFTDDIMRSAIDLSNFPYSRQLIVFNERSVMLRFTSDNDANYGYYFNHSCMSYCLNHNSLIELAHIKTDEDINRYRGIELDAVYIIGYEPKKVSEFLLTRIRGNENIPKRWVIHKENIFKEIIERS